MTAQLGTNYLPLAVGLPILALAAIGIGWMIKKNIAATWKRIVMAVVGIFALFGLAAVLLIASFHANISFADTFRIYAYTALAPSGDPFQFAREEFHPVLMMRDVANVDGTVTQISHPNPDYPTLIAIFAPGKYIEADMKDDAFTIPSIEAGSLPRVIKTSLWWALTSNIHNLVSSAN